jgi:hypothetical protein
MLAVLLALAASIFFAFDSGSAETCIIRTPGASECRQVEGESFINREGSGGVVVLALPVVLSLLVLLALFIRPAWTFVPAIVLLFANLIALASVGLLYLPATLFGLTAGVMGWRSARSSASTHAR